jgi:hypothetical protein
MPNVSKNGERPPCQVCGWPADGSKGYCQAHYARLVRYGDPEGEPAPKREGPCGVAGCERPILARGLCARHYDRLLRYGDPEGEPAPRTPRPPKPCKEKGCSRPHLARGWCAYHYQHIMRLEKKAAQQQVNP